MAIKKFNSKLKESFQYDQNTSGKNNHLQYAKTTFIATGGTILTPGDGYKYHYYTGSGPFNVRSGGKCDILIIAGGAGGACAFPYGFIDTSGGGGGAGGFRILEGIPVTAGSYVIGIGAGGPAGNVNGSPSTITGPPNFTSITNTGGGTGGRWVGSTQGASPGGSGGGNWNSGAGGSGIEGQGNPGGSGSPFRAAGGGGAGGSGRPGDTDRNGGLGYNSFSGSFDIPPSYGRPGPTAGRWFAGGGGGGAAQGYPAGTGGSGSLGGGPYAGAGGGAPYPGGTGGNGFTNTGGGGGGGPAGAPINRGGSGGSGLVIIRYLI